MSSIETILNRYAEEVKAVVVEGADLADFDELYDDLFQHFCETNEMPYGTAKARDGDPYEWLTLKLKELWG